MNSIKLQGAIIRLTNVNEATKSSIGSKWFFFFPFSSRKLVILALRQDCLCQMKSTILCVELQTTFPREYVDDCKKALKKHQLRV